MEEQQPIRDLQEPLVLERSKHGSFLMTKNRSINGIMDIAPFISYTIHRYVLFFSHFSRAATQQLYLKVMDAG